MYLVLLRPSFYHHPLFFCVSLSLSLFFPRYEFAREKFLGIKTLQTIAGLKRQLLELLSASGFVRSGLRSRAVEGVGRRSDSGRDGCCFALEHGVFGLPPPTEQQYQQQQQQQSAMGLGYSGGQQQQQQQQLQHQQQSAMGMGYGQTSPLFPNSYQGGGGGQMLFGSDSSAAAAASSVEEKAPLLKALLVAALFPQVFVL